MLSRLASYLLGGPAESEEGEVQQQQQPQDVAAVQEDSTGIKAVPVEARLRQVEVEGDDWILIDRNVEGAAPSMDESWYVTPPACFTQTGPVHVETSPLEDLLIEHPSMSVYRAAGPKPHHHHHHHHHHHKDNKSAGDKQRTSKRRTEPEAPARMPLAPRNNLTTCNEVVVRKARPSHHHRHHHHHHHHNAGNNKPTVEATPAGNAPGPVAEQPPRRSSVRDIRGDENLRIVQIRSAQKVLEKRTSQTAKRNLLERGNKVREVAAGSRRPSKRQDRIRLNNSGANNNRKRY